MSLDKIREAVLKTSRTEAEHATAAATKQAKEKLAIQKEALAREVEYQFQTRSRLVEEEYSRQLAHFQGAAAKELLEAKNASVRSIFDRARKTVLSWPQDRYGQVMKEFLTRIAEGQTGCVRVHGDDRTAFAALIEELNEGREVGTRLAVDDGTLPERGGFLFISDEFEVDATLRTIFEDIEQSVLPEIARDLTDI